MGAPLQIPPDMRGAVVGGGLVRGPRANHDRCSRDLAAQRRPLRAADHQVDFVECYADGTLDLALEGAERYRDMFESEFHRHERAVRRGRETFLGEYAATNQGEFFATASECFFTVPAKLRHYHPGLYEVLGALYAVDPLEWFAEGG